MAGTMNSAVNTRQLHDSPLHHLTLLAAETVVMVTTDAQRAIYRGNNE